MDKGLRLIPGVAAAVVAFAGSALADKLDDIIASGKLRCAVVLDFPPMGSRVSANTPIGFEVDSCDDFAKGLGVKAEIVETPFPMTIEDTRGGGIVTATIAHLAQSTPDEFGFTSTDLNSDGTVSIAEGAPQRESGVMRASKAPGLGITPRLETFGGPVLTIGA
ncbi:hypothetical protein C2U72_23270 [Prosthecomicrobium hirschii]|nr:transporter substrate-binding domain-containing protein [Prosthecomicrobium hirschii]TPQ48302.1 hypothetical protein C2U72_23270 [Prosthecomicrobium hirschii]